MTIPPDVWGQVPDVPGKAREVGVVRNTFIALKDLEALCEGNGILSDCLNDMTINCLRYAETVCRFEQVIAKGQSSNENGEREEIERLRQPVHDTTIASINSLSRVLHRNGRDNQWISKVSADGRAGYGKFALLLAFEVVLQSREGGKNV